MIAKIIRGSSATSFLKELSRINFLGAQQSTTRRKKQNYSLKENRLKALSTKDSLQEERGRDIERHMSIIKAMTKFIGSHFQELPTL